MKQIYITENQQNNIFHTIKRIFINEAQQKRLFNENIKNEGVTYTNNGNGTIGVHLDANTDDESNKEVDTRIFGTKGDILGKYDKKRYKYKDKYEKRLNTHKYYSDLNKYISNGMHGRPCVNKGNKASSTAFDKRKKYYKYNDNKIAYNGTIYKSLEDVFYDNIKEALIQGQIRYIVDNYLGKSQEEDSSQNKIFNTYEKACEFVTSQIQDQHSMSDWALKSSERDRMWTDMMGNKIDRLSNYNDDDKVKRYEIINLPNTNVQVIALFKIDEFNFTDALKHGELRQNYKTDEVLGIPSNERKTIKRIGQGKGKEQLHKIPVTYDYGITPSISQNFSLGNRSTDGKRHFKDQYAYQDKSKQRKK